jgi:mono/diheme cytochrome c family protein
VVTAAISILAGGAGAGERAIDESHDGFDLYRSYCAVCHGIFADGNGPAAPVLTTPPPDLARLSERYGNPLPSDDLLKFIDGRKMARSHGTSDMPIWGERLYEGNDRPSLTLEKVKQGTLLRIIEYLQAIQIAESTESSP